VDIMATLRSPAGCPWDREQTHATLRSYLLEETYEALDALDRSDFDALRGELGDVLFQCIFHAQVAVEQQRWDIVDVVDALVAKLVRRHPHVFQPDGRPLTARDRRRADARTPKAVLEQWEQVKAREQGDSGKAARLLAGVPRALPALLRANKIGGRVATVGFDWQRARDVLDKIDEEVRELRASVTAHDGHAREEMGDLLFSIANLSRKLGIEPEAALAAANDKFTARFDAVETALEQRGLDVHRATQDDMEQAWQQVKATAPRSTRRRPSSSHSGPSRRSPSPPRRRDLS
jgi:ATP diphosphatase